MLVLKSNAAFLSLPMIYFLLSDRALSFGPENVHAVSDPETCRGGILYNVSPD
jgi:hypothetical protein